MTTTPTKRAPPARSSGSPSATRSAIPTEFHSVPSILAKYGPWRRDGAADAGARHRRHADDAGAGQGAADRHGPRRARARHGRSPYGEEFIAWNRSPENNRAPGNTCLRACDLLERTDRPWQDASQIGSKGCGANMRVAPVGLVPGLSDEQRAGAAQLQSALTHGHPTALAASDLTAHAVRLLAQGDRAGRTGRAAAVVRRREPQPLPRALARRPVDAQSGPDAPRTSSRRGWDECLAVLDRLEDALRAPLARDRPVPGHRRGLDRRRGPGDRRCCASCSSPTSR